MSPILDQYGNPIRTAAASAAPQMTNRQNERMLQARFDSQYTTDENRRHWALADSMSVDAAADPGVRRTLRSRSRYEYHNNSYYMGIADTIGNYVIGTGPRLQMLTRDKYLNGAIEKLWKEWAKAVRLAQTLKVRRVARLVSGESLVVMRYNPRLSHPVKLDLHHVEIDQLSSPTFDLNFQQYPDRYFDGVVLDEWANPLEYHVLRQHPGAFGLSMMIGTEYDVWPARYVLHDFKVIRPGQRRGVPESVPALPLFAQLRRFALAVIGAAETAADYAAVIQSDQPAGEGADEPEMFDAIKLKVRMATVMPQGYTLGQVKAEQPTTTFDAFTWCILREICRCLNIPPVFASMDSEKTNMSSAYVVSQPFAKSVQVDRDDCDADLDRVFDEFLTEAIRVPGLIADYYRRQVQDALTDGKIKNKEATRLLANIVGDRLATLPDEFPHAWMWPSINTHADPSKVASAQASRLSSGTTTIPREFAKEGLDWEEEQEHAAASLGISVDAYRALLRQKMFGNGNPVQTSSTATAGAPNQPGTESTPAAGLNEEDDAGEDIDP